MNPPDDAIPLSSVSAPETAVKMDRRSTPPTSPTRLTSAQPDLKAKTANTGPQQDLVSRILQFLSTATPEVLAAVAVGLAAVTYFILGQVGLILIGAFGGITLFVSWEAKHPEVSRAVRGERGVDLIERVLTSRHQPTASAECASSDDENQSLIRGFQDFQPETRDALNELADAVIRDYVNWWYSPIVPHDRSFAMSCRRTFTNFLLAVSNHLYRKRPADAFLDFITHSSSIVIVFFAELQAAFAELPPNSSITAVDTVYNYLASNPDSSLANLLSQKQQSNKFKMVAEDLLIYLDRGTQDCDPARVFLREILSSIVLEGTLQSCSKAEWINGWLVYLLESGEPDLNQVIDEGMNNPAFADIDGNVGNISLAKGNRNSFDMEKARRKEKAAHKKQLSKADEEMETAMEEAKRLTAMIAEEEAKRKAREEASVNSEKVSPAKRNSEEQSQDPLQSGTKSGPETTISQASAHREAPLSPLTPRSTIDLSSLNSSPSNQPDLAPTARFTSFDQIVPPGRDEEDEEGSNKPPAFTLHNASITVLDDATNDKNRLRSKPTWEYLIQVEPASSHHPGWMAMKNYSALEPLHESLRRIANISGATAFLEAHGGVPNWRLHTRESLRGEIERYLRSAAAERPLADSEAMKRFLDKDANTRPHPRSGFSFDSMGKNVLDAVSSAPKGVFDGGKNFVVGGVTGVLGNIGLGQRKSTSTPITEQQPTPPQSRPLSLSALPRMDSTTSISGTRSRDSMDSQRSSIISTQPGKMPGMERRPSVQIDTEPDSLQPRPDRWERKSLSAASSRGNSRASSMAALRSPLRSPSEMSLSGMKLPPPPNEIADDYDSPVRSSLDTHSRTTEGGLMSPQTSFNSNRGHSPSPSFSPNHKIKASEAFSSSNKQPRRQFAPWSEPETRVAVELLFAVINELYTLSSAWNIRRTLLTAAKSFLLRPGNPSLTSIQKMIQESVLEANTSDSGLAHHIKKLRQNSLPTEDERKAWPAEMTVTEKEELRVKARKLFIQSGVPAALMGVMGQAATSEALGRLFDCLQIEEVARGLVFGLLLQAVRVITH